MPWTVYILRCGDGTLYTGVTNDLERRLAAHRDGRGAAYTRGRGPFEVAYREPARGRGLALRREWKIKRLSRSEKEILIMPKRSTMDTAEFTGFGKPTLEFFRRLKRRNNRQWFEVNKPIYLLHVKQPMEALIEEMDVRFARFAPEIVGHPKRSMFRIYRDVRFSRDKSPYKTHAACWFYHRDAGKGVGGEAHGGAGFYFHLAPEGSSIGAGIWMPPRPTVATLREAIVEDQRGFERILLAPAFRRRFGNLDDDGGVLKRLPRGFEEGHPATRWLKYQSFTVGRQLTKQQVTGRDLPRLLERNYRALVPFVRWLNRGIGYGEAKSRV